MRIFSPFRIRLLLALPFVALLVACVATNIMHHAFNNQGFEVLQLGSVDIGANPTGISVSWTQPAFHVHRRVMSSFPSVAHHSFLGTSWRSWRLTSPNGAYPVGTLIYCSISLAYWLALLLSLFPVALYHHSTRHHRRRIRRLALGLCPTCGYDLRAHSPGQKCPECGTPISEPSTTKTTDH